MVKLNLGCWKRNFPGWINIDVMGYPHVHFKRDIKDLSIFDDNSVDLVYSSHSLEYFTLDEAVDKVLEKDGNLIFHKMIYDEALLTRLLKERGFTGLRRYLK